MSNPTTRHRQVRVQITGGIGDLEAWAEEVNAIAEEQGFAPNFQDGPKRFGDHGPLHKLVLGYVTKP